MSEHKSNRQQKNKPTGTVIAIAAAVVILGLGGVLLLQRKGTEADSGAAGVQAETGSSEEALSSEAGTASEDVTGESGETAGESAVSASDEETTAEDTGSGSGSGGSSSGGSGGSGSSAGGSGSGTSVKPKYISLPYALPDQPLELGTLASFKGLYLEDGSDKMVSDVAVLSLKNTGKKPIEFLRVTLHTEEEEYIFEASAIPAGAIVAIQEAGKKACPKEEDKLTDVSAEIAELDALEMNEDLVKVEDNGDDSITVTNLTDKEIPTVRVFYKLYMADENAYVGGITYNAKLLNLPAGGNIKIKPSHYLSDGAMIMMVRVYDTVQK